MSDNKKPEIGSIQWIDLTIDDAGGIRDFYKDVIGWESAPVSMGDYDDYSMLTPGPEGEAVSGICHQRGGNVGLPSKWLIYVTVADLDKSMEACKNGGGKVIFGPKSMGGTGRYCMIEDPAGAVCALMEYA